jgi:hypothetical protein
VEEANKRRRRWLALVVLGLLLHGLAMINSDLGLDAHVRLNVAMDEQHDGQDLSWGKLRLSDSTVQQPSSDHVYDGYVPPWFQSELAVKTTAFVGVLLVALLAGFNPTWRASPHRFEPMWSALVLLSPIFLFVSGRGYDEGILACVVGAGVGGYFFNKGDQRHERFLHVVFMATSLLILLGWKGFDMSICLGVWTLTFLVGWAYVIIEQRLTNESVSLLRHPWKMATLCSTLVYVGVALYGWWFGGGTFGIIADQPVNYLVSSIVAIAHGFVVFLLIGFMLWPLLARRWSGVRELRGPGATMLVVYGSVLLTGIACYIGALWTLESTLWNRSLFSTMLVLGNNGRYATALLIPCVLVLKWSAPSKDTAESEETLRFMMGIGALVPLMLFIALFGQQLWSDDAGAWLAEEFQEEDNCFVMVAPKTLAMHHLYVLKTHVDATGEFGIDGYWRTSDHVGSFLESQPECSSLVIVAPGENYSPNASEYEVVAQEQAPFSLSGGGTDDAWRVFRATT